ncbi:MAG: 1-acyl-sn-glycerol-3-phosphate acyltransferase [Chitinophagaceae bacterium]|nr:1-acyl-sn-glycerol-3-phosphate acyltransferase [Chitinophagaceae bacterium]
MTTAKNILGRLSAFWALIIFFITMLIVVIPLWAVGLVEEPRRTVIFQHISRIWMQTFFLLTGVRIDVKGKEHFRKGENYVVVSNHNSFMDVPLTTPFIPGPNKTIAKVEMARIPLFGMIYRRGSVLVDRKSEESRKSSYHQMKEVLTMGMHMCIYPEGTRNKTSQPLQAFHNGAFRLALDSGKAILPTVIFNTAKVLPINKPFFYWPVRIRMHFLPAVPVGNLTIDQLKEKVHAIIREYYVKHKDQ